MLMKDIKTLQKKKKQIIWLQNLSKDEKQKLVKYKRNYRYTKDICRYMTFITEKQCEILTSEDT